VRYWISSLITVLILGFSPISRAQSGLPDIGSSAGEILSPEQEAQYGAYTLYELRRMNYVLEDPLLTEWLDGMGNRIAASSDNPKQSFTFFLLKDRQINAFATLGGYIGTNAGLILNAKREDEVASVMAHEVAHVTQRHVLRGVERARKDQLPILLAMIGAIAAAQASSKSDSADNATGAILASGQALAVQRQIDYTRSNEAEADRIGLQTLNRSGYDVNAMGDFFETLQRITRNNSGPYSTPDYLRSHPVTLTRVSEAREGARRINQSVRSAQNTPNLPNSPLLPRNLQLSHGVSKQQSDDFLFARERLRVLSARNSNEAIEEYERMQRAAPLTDAQRYGLAVAYMGKSLPAKAESLLAAISGQNTNHFWVRIGKGEALLRQQNKSEGMKIFDELITSQPENRAVRLSLAKVLVELADKSSAQRAQAVLRPLLSKTGDDPVFHQTFARASELAGDRNRAAESYAEYAYYTGRPEDALNQLNELLKRKDLDYVQRARVESSIAILMPIVLEMRKQGMRPERQEAPRVSTRLR
jgi:beta-barrel assembly-enhancing protease